MEEGVSEIIVTKGDHFKGGLSRSYHSDVLYCIIFQFLDYFASVDLFVTSVCPGDFQ